MCVGCSGDPTVFEAFWRETGALAEIVIPGWQTMSYFSDVGNVCWFLEPEFGRQVRRLHRTVRNAAAGDEYHVVVGTGSTQLFMAALYALSPSGSGDPISIVSTAPYYSVSAQNFYLLLLFTSSEFPPGIVAVDRYSCRRQTGYFRQHNRIGSCRYLIIPSTPTE